MRVSSGERAFLLQQASGVKVWWPPVPLRAAQLFVRCSSLEELGEALGRALQKIARPPDERTLIALQAGAWATVVGDDFALALAQPLSERFGTALVVRLDGGRLALTVQTWDAGVPGDEERDPRPPHFRDVEAAAWELLRYLEVPPALRLLTLAGVEVLEEDVVAALPALRARASPDQVEVTTVSALPLPREEGPSPPAEPDVVVESRAGEARALEVRELPGGIPSEAWAQALAAIEEAQALRLVRALSDGDEPRMPRPTFAYRSQQPVRVEKLLATARRERPWLSKLFDPEREPPLTRAGFTQVCREKLGELPVVRAHGRSLELEAGPRCCLRAPIEKAYEVYLATLEAGEAAARLEDETRALLRSPAPLLSLDHLLPTLLAGDPGERVVRQLAPDLYAALLCDDGQWIAPVLATELAAAGSDPNAAFARAIARASALTDAAPEGIRWFDLEHGRVVICEFPDEGAAGRLLSPHTRELILHILGEDLALAAAPTRDTLLACAASDDAGAEWLAGEALRRFEEGPFPIHAGLWRIGPDLLEAVGDGGRV
jgi:hypothetical protein